MFLEAIKRYFGFVKPEDVDIVEGRTYTGTVKNFDSHVGLGEITIHKNGVLSNQSIPFHCVNIADGSREVALDLRVSFVAFWHPRGRFEAKEITPMKVGFMPLNAPFG